MSKTYTVSGVSGSRIIQAKNENEARHLAMLQKWGPPTGIYSDPYKGLGLTVTEIKE